MTERPGPTKSTTRRLISALRELISALDRRVPHGERPGETRIARDASDLRRAALARIRSLTGVGVVAGGFNQELAEAIMTDDGGPGSNGDGQPHSTL